MELGIAFFIVAVLIVCVWVIIGIKRIKHKVFAIFLIFFILFLYVSSFVVFKGADIDFKSVAGLTQASKLYLSWLGSVFSNLKVITINAIKMDWDVNKTIG